MSVSGGGNLNLFKVCNFCNFLNLKHYNLMVVLRGGLLPHPNGYKRAGAKSVVSCEGLGYYMVVSQNKGTPI